MLAVLLGAVLALGGGMAAGCASNGEMSGAATTGGSASPVPASPMPATLDQASAPVPRPTSEPDPLRLVTLGDGYAAGTDTSSARRDSWPAQLAQAMDHGDIRLRLIDNLAETGHTSEDVRRVQLPQLEALAPDVVMLQVGVNDIIARDISLEDYRTNLAAILDTLLTILPARHIFLVTTPDHTLTPRGGDYGSRDAGRADVAEANATLATLAAERDMTVIDISAVNQRVTEDRSLIVGQGPYPSAKQYAGWVEVIGPELRRVLLAERP
jgi:lysophospholipase L1-like esterase